MDQNTLAGSDLAKKKQRTNGYLTCVMDWSLKAKDTKDLKEKLKEDNNKRKKREP